MILALSGCAAFQTEADKSGKAIKEQRRQEREAKLEPARKSPLSFSLPKAESDAAWARAQVFIARHSSMKLQTATDFVIETFNPISVLGDPQFGYSANRAPTGETFLFEVKSFSDRYDAWGIAAAADNSHLFAHFVRTGEMLCEECIEK